MGRDKPLDTHGKALRINLDPHPYGSFAEIGAGQEVARWFFRVGAAAGTIAKTMSAYDMTVSDAIYGPVKRYVSRERLQAMLDHEYDLNRERLDARRGATTTFFAFADTVSARNYEGTNECHGWMGVKFQAHPRDAVSQIILHVRMLDVEAALQQEALGIVGVNLLYGACFLSCEPERLIESLLDGLTTQRIEIDMIEFSGAAFLRVDNRLMSMKLVQLGLAGAAMFGPDGAVLQPAEVFYKKHILVERGSFRPVCHPHMDMMASARRQFCRDYQIAEENLVCVMELTMRHLLAGPDAGIDPQDFLARADLLGACGQTVLVSDYSEFHRLTAYLTRNTKCPIGLVMGLRTLGELLEPKYYEQLQGGLLEGFGRLFRNDLSVYIYPQLDRPTGRLLTLRELQVAPTEQRLFDWLLEMGRIRALEQWSEDALRVRAREVLERIAAHDPHWKSMVPPPVAKLIADRGFFGGRPDSPV